MKWYEVVEWSYEPNAISWVRRQALWFWAEAMRLIRLPDKVERDLEVVFASLPDRPENPMCAGCVHFDEYLSEDGRLGMGRGECRRRNSVTVQATHWCIRFKAQQ